MMFFVVAFALLLHVFFWGTGLAALAMPSRWRHFWTVLVMPAGFALQSLVVWGGAYADLPGTDAYAWHAELVPICLLAVAWRRFGARRLGRDLLRFGLVLAAMAGVLLLLTLPHAIASRGLTTLSLGSCDAADYAAGARVFMEFARSDRTGFLGLTEVVRVMSADNFYDFWLRLNHFTPSALIALNGSVLDCAPHEITGLLTAVILAGSVPVVFWIGRAVFGYTGAASLVIAAVYGISPVTWYSMAQVSPAPLLAAQALAMIAWSGIALWNGRLSWRRGLMFSGVLGIGYVLVLGSYNFILLVGLTPPVAYAAALTVRSGGWARFGRWAGMLLLPLVIAGIVFWTRVAGLAERFALFQTYDFGWRIPALTPEGWLGMVQGGDLMPWSWGGLRWLLALVVVVAFGWALARSALQGRRRVWLIASVTVPILAGYAFLQIRGRILGTNASYDAFKLFAVFFPLLLPAFCWWITLRWSTRLLQWVVVAGLAVVVIGFNLVACIMFVVQLSRPPLLVDAELRQLRRIEAMADVHSVNLLIPDMWSRLWANALLLHKPQYFLTHTYEGRLNTTLRGEWDLVSGVLRVNPGRGTVRPVTPRYELIATRAAAFVRPYFGAGWHDEERLPNGDRWRWTRGEAAIEIENPHAYPVRAAVVLEARALSARDVALVTTAGRRTPGVSVTEQRAQQRFEGVELPPGRTVLTLVTSRPADTISGDARPLGLCVYRLELVTEPGR